ncbi:MULTISPECIES: sensor histidine kinase [Streptosporangium]|uniref:histidine kinase n=1 Tax=Streptosporangium brasiliense TaxID=47480 RepID=A0ABT9R4E0_9ACTN|nr:nitrate- and nitrite sensing domain-containing protein [Streptosporangium brasiliense]MDP9863752.1 signal transduction histidine kinase [Streptosporangium brasiliense]
MGSGNRSIRFKIFLLLLLPLLSLSALWGFVLNLTVGDGAALLRANSVYQTIGVSSTELGLQLQAERAQSSVAITSRILTSEIGEQRGRTDRSVEKFREAALSDSHGPELRSALDTLIRQLDRLPAIRAGIDSGRDIRLEVLTNYNRILDSVFLLYDQLAAVPDLSIFQQAAAMQSMGNAREMIARENALISGALIDYRMTPGERTAFGEYAATRRFLHARGLSALDSELGDPYRATFDSTAFEKFVALERAVAGTPDERLPPEARNWKTTTNGVATWLDQLNLASSKMLADRAQSVATGIMVRIGIAGGIGLIAVIASIIISVRFGRRLAAELAGLRSTALDLADVRLPRVVERLRRGEEVDVQAEAPPIAADGSIEIRDVAHAFDSVQHTAVEAAVGQANLRRGVSQVFVNLARRKQGLLHRQLTLLDSMQRRATDPDSLEDLFRLDHLTTRMRRHAESLIILSGAAPGRAWRRPVAVVDIVRAAIAEVEDYKRVSVPPMPDASLDGAAVADITHLIAELIENATIYSPPQTTVTVRGDVVANGFAVEVEDRGLGLSAMEYAAINERLASPPEFDLADSDRLGLFVVGQLAARHGIQVLLRGSAFGGTTAIVLIPRAVLAETPSPLTLTAERLTERPADLPQPAQPAALPPARSDSGLPRRTRTVPSGARPPVPPLAAPTLAVVTDLPELGADREASGGPARGGTGEPARETTGPGTLPRRVRQANLAPQLRQEAQAPVEPERAAEPPEDPEQSERSPDEVRALFSAFQAGARRGREEEHGNDFAHQTTGDKGD